MSTTEALAPEDSFRLREYLGVLRVRKWSIIVITLLALLAALFYIQRKTPQFTSSAKVLATNPIANFSQGSSVEPNMDTELALVGSSDVVKCAVQFLNQATGTGPVFQPSPSPAPSPTGTPKAGATPSPSPTPTPVSELTGAQLCSSGALAGVLIPPGFKEHLGVTVPPSTDILVISYSSKNKGQAQATAESVANGYIQIKTLNGASYLEGLRTPLESQIAALSQKIQTTTAALIRAIANGDTQTQAYLQTQLNNFLGEQQGLQQNLNDLCTCKLTPPQLETDATLPAGPSSPNKPLIAFAGLFIGLAIGIGIAFVRERLDDRLRGRGDLEEHVGAPVLAVVPQVPGWKRKGDAKLISIEQPKASVAESYRTLRTSVLFAAAQRGLKTLMVTSPTAGEGKTTTAANLAVVLADAGKRVILVSADLRKPRIHKFFNLSNEAGLSSVLAGEVKPWEALADPGREHLRVMASGPVPAHPAELLQSEQMGELVEELREVADFVILDTAPVLLVADALALAPLVDGVLFVVDAETTHRGAVSQAREQLEQVGAPLIGSVFNNFDPAKARAYSQYGYYGNYRYRYRYGGYGGYYGGGYGGDLPRDGDRRRRAPALEAPPEPPP